MRALRLFYFSENYDGQSQEVIVEIPQVHHCEYIEHLISIYEKTF